MEVILCPKCSSEIAVDDINSYDVDCDCGEILISTSFFIIKENKIKDNKMKWYRFWKTIMYTGHKCPDTYRQFSDKCDESDIQCEVEYWAETISGGHSKEYHYGCEEIKHPPKEWLEKEIKTLDITISNIKYKKDNLLKCLNDINEKEFCKKNKIEIKKRRIEKRLGFMNLDEI